MKKKNKLHYELYGSSAGAGKKGIGAGLYSRAERRNRCSSVHFVASFPMQKNMQMRQSRG
jgi:hypothetical protein